MNSALQILGYGAWNGGTLTDNSMYENAGMFFKGNIPVTNETILERIGIRTRMVAPEDVRIGTIALEDLLENNDFDLSRVKIIIGATNVGDDKFDHGPLIRYPFDIIKEKCPSATAFDLYAGCPGYNVSVELLLMLSLTGYLKEGDISIVVGAENIHRCKAFKPENTSNIIFGDDSLATALETTCSVNLSENSIETRSFQGTLKPDFSDQLSQMAEIIHDLNGSDTIDGIIMDNKMGVLPQRVPATASRLQHRLALRMHSERVGQAKGFKGLLELFDNHVDSFAFDINTLGDDPDIIKTFAQAYIRAGKQRNMVSIFLRPDHSVEVTVHKGDAFVFTRPEKGIVDARTRTHGCFAPYIQAVNRDGELFGEMNGKGVFLYATRGARSHIEPLLGDNDLSMEKLDLLIEHQANFAMLPMTLEKVLANGQPDLKKDIMDYLANKMITNIHERGNCSVVCMQRLPYDLANGALKPDTINGLPINRNLDALRSAKTILNDSVGAGMTRSSFLQRLD
jgi:3-oxoacyl-[acyl-carrier-protein] synthase III